MPLQYTYRHSISPTGEFLAFSGGNLDHCRVYKTGDDKALAEFKSRVAVCEFSTDGRWLVVGDFERFQVISTTDWQVKHVLPRDNANKDAAIAFSKTGALAALVMAHNRVQLFATNGWRELASFESPSDARINELAISPMGDRLAAATVGGEVCCWDLRKIRHGLKNLTLDWAAPDFPPPSNWQSAEEVRIETE